MSFVSLKIEGYLANSSYKPTWRFHRPKVKLDRVPPIVKRQLELAINKNCRAFIIEVLEPEGVPEH